MNRASNRRTFPTTTDGGNEMATGNIGIGNNFTFATFKKDLGKTNLGFTKMDAGETAVINDMKECVN